jgi:phosphoenolpyruvate carboxylase
MPSWYGVGTALSELERLHPALFVRLCEQLNQVDLLNYVLHNVETTVASASEEIMLAYADLVDDRAVRSTHMELILSELRLTRKNLMKVFGESIEHRRPGVMKTISLREPSLKLLHKMQIQLLKEWRHTDPDDRKQRDMLLEKIFSTINAIAGGLRNTG